MMKRIKITKIKITKMKMKIVKTKIMMNVKMRRCFVWRVCANGFLCGFLCIAKAASLDVDRQIAFLLGVENEGRGNESACEALRKLETAEGTILLKLLSAMKDANDLSRNWLRAAAEEIVKRESSAGRDLPIDALGAFVLDLRQHPRARRYAFEMIAQSFPETAQRILSGMLNDPSVELRRDAINQHIDQARQMQNRGRKIEAILLFQQALGAARDVDQIEMIADRLQHLGKRVDLPKHFGFLMDWQVLGPFDNSDRRGFEAVFAPEKEIDLSRSYRTKTGMANWQTLRASSEYGMLDINRAFGPLKEATAYAYANFESDFAQSVELRLGCKNAWKLWLNGELLFGRDEYHRGMRIDQYRMQGQLKKGANAILIKVCQNEQVEDWTIEWQFQLRICDATGTAVLDSNRLTSN